MEPRRAAIIVGVNRYDQDSGIRPLEYAVDDCTQLHGFLQYRAGYDTTRLLLEPNKAQVLEAFEQVTATLGPGDLLVFFFAGHGVEFNGKHLLLCRPARLSRLRHFDEVIPVEQVRDETAKPGLHRLIILDSCRSDLLHTRGAPGGEGLKGEKHLRDIVARMSQEREVDAGSVAVLCSCPENAQALELPAVRQGLFTAAFLEEMQEAVQCGGELKLSDTFIESLSQRMARLAREHGQNDWKQRPWVQWSGVMPAMIAGTAVPERPTPAPSKLESKPEPPKPEPPQPDSQALAVVQKLPGASSSAKPVPPASPRTKPKARASAVPPPLPDTGTNVLHAVIDIDVREIERATKSAKGASDYLKTVWKSRQADWARAAGLGWPAGQWLMGACLEEGLGTTANPAQAVKLYRQAADQGFAPAQYNLGFCYGNSRGVPQDATQAIKWYRKAADQGYAPAQFKLAIYYENGAGVPQDKTQAARLYRQAADQGHAIAQFNLALCYDQGTGVPQDKPEAARLYRQAADQGHASAQYNLALCYDNGWGVAPDKTQAFQWYLKAASQGQTAAQFNLGVSYDKGDGVAQDKAQAVHWYRKAADQGYPAAQYNLALCYANGTGVAANKAEAVKWYRQAAEKGHPAAQFNYAVRLDNGDGIAQNKTEAVQWYRKAAEQGHASAQYNLGVCYENGEGVAPDKNEAAKWYRKAAEQGNAAAQKALKRKCYLSTAAADVMGWADDGPELNLLRRMRDTYMMRTPARRAQVAAYYQTAPRIVHAIDAAPRPAAEWRSIAHAHLLPVLALLRSGNLPAAHHHYQSMVHELTARWLHRPLTTNH